mgnify:CR=1 FL=1
MGTDFRRCGEIDEEMKQKLNEMYVGRLIHILSHTMKRHNPAEVMENDDLTTMQKHVLKFILLETMHRDLYQKDIEEEFQIRKPTVTGILKLMEKNGYIYRESAKQDARLKQIIPTEKAEKIRPAILKSIEEGEAKMLRGIPKEDVELFKKYIGPNVKIKAAGGVSSMEDLEMFLELGCERIGTSRAVGLCKGELTEGY